MRLDETTTEHPHPLNRWIATQRLKSTLSLSDIDLHDGPSINTQRGIEDGSIAITDASIAKYMKAFPENTAVSLGALHAAYLREGADRPHRDRHTTVRVNEGQIEFTDGDEVILRTRELLIPDERDTYALSWLLQEDQVQLVPTDSPGRREHAKHIGVLGEDGRVDLVFTGHPMPEQYTLKQLSEILDELGRRKYEPGYRMRLAVALHGLIQISTEEDVLLSLSRCDNVELAERIRDRLRKSHVPRIETQDVNTLREMLTPFADAAIAGVEIGADGDLASRPNASGGHLIRVVDACIGAVDLVYAGAGRATARWALRHAVPNLLHLGQDGYSAVGVSVGSDAPALSIPAHSERTGVIIGGSLPEPILVTFPEGAIR